MKKILLTLSLVLISVSSAFAWSTSTIRQNARFLSDRMAYELDMTPRQYDDCYEINYDFLVSVNRIMDDVVYGYTDAIDRYYTYLDWRNDDLRYILTASQYRQMMLRDYFYRPVYTYFGHWSLRVFQLYNNHKFFYFDAPSVYRTYSGSHSRNQHANGYYGSGRYTHEIHSQATHIHGSQSMNDHSRADFGHNRRERGDKQSMNGYNNRNQNNRTKDERYTDDRGNKNHNSQQINDRNHQNGTQGNAQSGNRGNTQQGKPQNNNQQGGNSRNGNTTGSQRH